MSSAPTILIYGRDMALLDTRRMVLESAGFKVKTVGDLTGAAQTLSAMPVILSILCHTLSPEERRSLLEIIRYVNPESKVLVLQASRNGRDPASSEPVVSIFDGPGKLVATVREMMRSITATAISEVTSYQ